MRSSGIAIDFYCTDWSSDLYLHINEHLIEKSIMMNERTRKYASNSVLSKYSLSLSARGFGFG